VLANIYELENTVSGIPPPSDPVGVIEDYLAEEPPALDYIRQQGHLLDCTFSEFKRDEQTL